MVDLFAGCGGLSLGLEQAGFTPWFVNEIVEQFANTYKVNHQLSDKHYFIGDIALLNEHIEEYIIIKYNPCMRWSSMSRFFHGESPTDS